MLESIAMLVTPFAAFLLADLIHASGVLAVVLLRLVHEPGDAADHRCGHPADRHPFLGARHDRPEQLAVRADRCLGAVRVPRAHQRLDAARARRRARGHCRGDRRPVGVDLHHAVRDPAARPPSGPTGTPHRCPPAHGERGGRLPRRRLPRRDPRRAPHAGLRCAVPGPGRDRAHHLWGDRADPAAGAVAAGRGAVRPATSSPDTYQHDLSRAPLDRPADESSWISGTNIVVDGGGSVLG